MIENIQQFLEKYNLNSSGNTLLVGFSGGADSLCLLDILGKLSAEFGFKLVALHLNHNFREEAEEEAQNCSQFCASKKIKFIQETLPLQDNHSEEFARNTRYEFFLKYAKKFRADGVFTAHTKSDNAETIVYRIAKGTGIKGLQGILEARDFEGHMLYRPLLDFAREDIENYCEQNCLKPNYDSSNKDLKYRRNLIRYEVLPQLRKINPVVNNAIVSLSNVACEQSKIIDEYMRKVRKKITNDDDKILSRKFKKLSTPVKKQLVYDLFLQYNLDYDYKKITDVLEFIRKNINSKDGSKCSLTSNLWLFVSAEYIYTVR